MASLKCTARLAHMARSQMQFLLPRQAEHLLQISGRPFYQWAKTLWRPSNSITKKSNLSLLLSLPVVQSSPTYHGCAESGDGANAPGSQQEGPFEVSLQYNGPAVLLWLWSNAHSSEDTGLKAQSIKHTAGKTGKARHLV